MVARHLRVADLIWVLLSVCFALAATASADEAQDSSKSDNPSLPTLSGFVDVRGVHSNDDALASKFMIGQAEIDLDQHIANRVDYFLAICYNNENEAFELGAAELHLSLLVTPRSQLTRAELIAGRFDVPFGIDYRYVASPDCELVCSPWYSHDVGNWNAWNDLGLGFSAGNHWSELKLYVVNGYEESAELVERVFNLATGYTEDSVVELQSSPEAAVGGRLGVLPAGECVELGLSAADGIDDNGVSTLQLFGGDASVNISRWRAQAELIYSTISEGELRTISRGCYLQLRHRLDRLRLIGRCAAVRDGGEDWRYQFSGGAAVPISTGTEVRVEVVRTPGNRVVSLFGIVAAF